MNTNGYTPEGPILKDLPKAPLGGSGASKIPKYAVQFSAHGCAWVPEKPKFVYTLEEAEAIRAEWLARADTVGGDVLITAEPPHIHLPCFPPDKECWPKGSVFY